MNTINDWWVLYLQSFPLPDEPTLYYRQMKHAFHAGVLAILDYIHQLPGDMDPEELAPQLRALLEEIHAYMEQD